MMAYRAPWTFKYLYGARTLSTSFTGDSLRRSYLYVPASNPRMLEKSITSNSDTIIYDLEDSVAPAHKPSARENLVTFLQNKEDISTSRYSVRVNALGTEFFFEDIDRIVPNSAVQTLVLPKVNSASDLSEISKRAPMGRKLNVIASIESAKALWNIGEISQWKNEDITLVGLLFAAEDYCADTGIRRSSSRQELLYTRSKIVAAAKAFGLQAIDMVCINYKDVDYLKDECEDGRRLGYDGKQAIHPSQVRHIQSIFAPSPQEIIRAANIVVKMGHAREFESRGAFGLELPSGGKEMIDEPMLKQAQVTIAKAKAAGLAVPEVDGVVP